MGRVSAYVCNATSASDNETECIVPQVLDYFGSPLQHGLEKVRFERMHFRTDAEAALL